MDSENIPRSAATSGQIVWEGEGFEIHRATKGFEVWQQKLTHAERVAVIGYEGQKGLDQSAIHELPLED